MSAPESNQSNHDAQNATIDSFQHYVQKRLFSLRIAVDLDILIPQILTSSIEESERAPQRSDILLDTPALKLDDAIRDFRIVDRRKPKKYTSSSQLYSGYSYKTSSGDEWSVVQPLHATKLQLQNIPFSVNGAGEELKHRQDSIQLDADNMHAKNILFFCNELG